MITNLHELYNNTQDKNIKALLKEIETRYFYLVHDSLHYDTIDDKTYEALVHLGDVINPERLEKECKPVCHFVTKFHSIDAT